MKLVLAKTWETHNRVGKSDFCDTETVCKASNNEGPMYQLLVPGTDVTIFALVLSSGINRTMFTFPI